MNSTESIRNLQSINGITIENLEARMRPRCDSGAGFLGSNESLREVIIKDTKTVTEMGLTHQEIAEFLRLFSKEQKGRSEHNGKEYFHYFKPWRGDQVSPFSDGTKASVYHTVINLENGARIEFSELLPEMIDRYGFYEGKTSYRLDPMEIARVAGITPMPPDNPIDPIVQLIKNPDASVVIRTAKQLREVDILYTFAKIDILSGKNYEFAPEDLEAVNKLEELRESMNREEESQSDTESEDDTESIHE
ncbi:MAG TPA: hypothetical protein VGL94_19075 [Ktedonobacteraceae bacterium]|jgi:hypothetical protein